MSELFDAKKAAQETTKAMFQKEIPVINDLIKKACREGKYSVMVRGSDCPYPVQCLLRNAGYLLEYCSGDYEVSWIKATDSLAKNEEGLMKVAKEAGVEVAKVQ